MSWQVNGNNIEAAMRGPVKRSAPSITLDLP